MSSSISAGCPESMNIFMLKDTQNLTKQLCEQPDLTECLI